MHLGNTATPYARGAEKLRMFPPLYRRKAVRMHRPAGKAVSGFFRTGWIFMAFVRTACVQSKAHSNRYHAPAPELAPACICARKTVNKERI